MAISGAAPETQLTIREFQPGDEEAFRTLNEEWITRYFALEPKDVATIAHPRDYILDRGGRIFLAVRDGRPIGCCALMFIAPGEFEVAKMAVTPSAQGSGIGRRLLQHTVAQARAAGAHRLYLETNHALSTAIHLYESIGFRHIPPERVIPSPYARADVYMELHLQYHESGSA